MSDERVWEEVVGATHRDMMDAAEILSWMRSDPYESAQSRLAQKIREIRSASKRTAIEHLEDARAAVVNDFGSIALGHVDAAIRALDSGSEPSR